LESPDDTVLLFEDEFSLSNTATTSYKWGRKGQQPTVACKQRGRERKTAMGSYNYTTGQITVTFHDKGNYKSFKKHLKKIMYTYKEHSKIIMVVDNVRFHHAKLLKAWLVNHPELEIIYLPPYSPELNPVERAWWYMRKKITHNRYVHTMKERMIAFWKMFSHFQKPNSELTQVCVLNY
jgi:transposase